jgi:hypothetical protein
VKNTQKTESHPFDIIVIMLIDFNTLLLHLDELEHATIKCMRGLLFSMMRQAHKVELFKGTQALNQALHAK